MSDGGWVPHPMGTLLATFWWPHLPSLLFGGMFRAAHWDFFGVLHPAGALLEAVCVICCRGQQQQGLEMLQPSLPSYFGAHPPG